MNTLRRNFGYKFLSLLVSILLYWIASGQKNNSTAKEIYVQPVAENLPENLILKSPPQGNPVQVSGTTPAVEAFRLLEPKATVDLTGAKVGTNRYPVKYLMPNGFTNALEVVGPPFSLITLEKKMTSKWNVEVLFNDNPPAGYIYSDGKSDPRTVQVVGLNSDIIRVQRVVASLDTSGAPGAISQVVDLVAQDVKQQAVENVQIIPSHVRATLGLKKTPSTKTVLLSIELNGSPDPAYEITGYEFIPSTVTISGTQEMLASQSSLRVPVDVDGLKTSTTKPITVQPPPGLRVVGGKATVRLRLRVRPIATPSPAVVEPTVSASPTPLPTTKSSLSASSP